MSVRFYYPSERLLNKFVEEYGQVYEAIEYLSGGYDANVMAIFDLHKRYADEVKKVFIDKDHKYYSARLRGELPPKCLLVRIGSIEANALPLDVEQKARGLAERLRKCPPSVIKEYQDICEDTLNFLFCEYVDKQRGLLSSEAQSPTDHGYLKRDLIFENRATEGFWEEVRIVYKADSIVFDAKNYEYEIDADPVFEMGIKYLAAHGLGLFGVIIARKVPTDAKNKASTSRIGPLSAAVEAQKNYGLKIRRWFYY